jgi:hypothetical protein
MDKAKICKSMYNCGCIILGEWVLGGVQLDTKGLSVVSPPISGNETLLKIIK